MVNPKVTHYFGKKSSQSADTEEKAKTAHDKQVIESMKKSIAGKLKDPAMAKKAAQILTQMIEGDKRENTAEG